MQISKNINLTRLKRGLSKTRSAILNRLNESLSGKAVIEESTLEEIEEILISSDMGVDLSHEVINNTRSEIRKSSNRSHSNFISVLKQQLLSKITFPNSGIKNLITNGKDKPYIILLVGINGVGKTTSLGKLAYNFSRSGLSILIGSADTFRAAANQQLEIWASRAGVEILTKNSGADPSSVAYDSIEIAQKRNFDIVLIDTAGRLHTKNRLMSELKKIISVINNKCSYAPNEILLVIDGNTGQNAVFQAREFMKYMDITGLIVTKMDGTSKGGSIFKICDELKIPIKYIGVGESTEDLQNFDPNSFVESIFPQQD